MSLMLADGSGRRLATMLGWMLALLLSTVAALAQDPSSVDQSAQPPVAVSGGPATRPVVQVALWYRQLADPAPEVRDAARVELMGLTRDDLSALREAVRAAAPPRPSQVSILYDIVTHVWLKGEAYAVNDRPSGFVGVLFDPDQSDSLPNPDGVEVRHRLRGFCAFHKLQDGDLVQAVLGPNPAEVHHPEDIIRAVMEFTAGQTATMQVLRHGQIVRVSLTLDARPAGLQGVAGALEAFREVREARADEYWEQQFAPLLGGTAF